MIWTLIIIMFTAQGPARVTVGDFPDRPSCEQELSKHRANGQDGYCMRVR